MNYSRGPRGGGASRGGDGQRITATVKWFNRTKGFGFITASDGSGDVFLPATALGNAGYDEVGEGATVVCDVVEGPKGRSVASVVTVDESTATPRQPRGGGYGGGGGAGYGGGSGGAYGGAPRGERGPPTGPAERLDGVVKWFDATRGFGFISPSDGGKDVFVHMSALRRSGLETLATGQNVRMMVQDAKRGREAASVEVI